MACSKKFIAPAMNTNMYENPIAGQLKDLAGIRIRCCDPAVDTSHAGIPEPGRWLSRTFCSMSFCRKSHMKRSGRFEDPCNGIPDTEAVDPVRYITNHSTGKMGYAIAKIASRRGAEVTLVSEPTAEEEPAFVNVVKCMFRKGDVRGS